MEMIFHTYQKGNPRINYDFTNFPNLNVDGLINITGLHRVRLVKNSVLTG